MKTTSSPVSELTEIAKHFPPMPDAQLISMVKRNGITSEKLQSLKVAFGKAVSK